MFITGVNDTGYKLFTGVNGFSVIAGVVDIGDKFLTGVNDSSEQLSPVTTTPAINLLPVTRTRMPWRWGAAEDRRNLKGTNR